MGSRLVKYEFSPKENEQIEAIIKVPEETRSVIHGVVIDCRHKPIKDAVVKLLEVLPGNPCRMKPLTHTFTDSCGQFLFGPLYCNKKYALKVWYSDVKIRELIISPDCDEHCDDCHSDDHSDDQYDKNHSDDYRDGHYSGYTDINFDDYFGGHNDDNSDDHFENTCAEESDDNCDDYDNGHARYDQPKEENRYERRRDERRRDRHSDDDNYIHYKAPKVYGQKCTKCEIGKKVNNFEDIEK